MGQVSLANMHFDDNVTVPYMEMNGERVYFTTQDEIFLNSQCLFVEYTDVVRSPYYMFLHMMTLNPENFREHYEIERLEGYDIPSLTEWYINRRYQNPLLDLLKKEIREKIPEEEMDKFISNEIIEVPDLIHLSPELNFVDTITKVTKQEKGIVKKVVVWYPFENAVIQEDIRDLFDGTVHFLSGPLEEVIDEIPNDSTYVFSDIMNIDVLLNKNRLSLSSVIIPKEYKYNYTEDGLLKINYEKYLEDALFKLNFFYASIRKVEEDEEIQ